MILRGSTSTEGSPSEERLEPMSLYTAFRIRKFLLKSHLTLIRANDSAIGNREVSDMNQMSQARYLDVPTGRLATALVQRASGFLHEKSE